MRMIRTVNRKNEFWHEVVPPLFTGTYQVTKNMVIVDSQTQGQVYMGFGGSFTEAAAYTFSQMSQDLQDQVLKAYFCKESGLGYTLGRVAIHSCDFALGNYTYVTEGDQTLESFDLSHEDQWVIPMIKKAQDVAGHDLSLLASPWSPPAYMKTNNDMNYGGHLREDMQALWANYYVEFVNHMKQRGIGIWGLSVQNEPQAVQVWDSCIYSPQQERDFIKNHLGPTLNKAGLSNVALLICDHNRDIIVDHAATVLSDPEAAQYVWGTGNHWYVSEAFDNLSVVHHMFPNKHILFTEGCVELTNLSSDTTGKKGYLGSWSNAEIYGRNIIGDFNNWSEGWIDWNLLLNEEGGPNHVNNFCEAPIMYDRVNKQVMINPSYYYIGHFSRYMEKGATRLKTMVYGDDLHAVCFENPNGQKVVVIQNQGFIKDLALVIDGQGVNLSLADRSITTIIV